MKRKSRFRKTASFLATCAGLTSACICVLIISGEWHSARSNYEIHHREVEGWEACRQANPEYYAASEQSVVSSRENLAQAQNNVWVRVSKVQLAGFLALGGLGSAVAGYLATWIVLMFGHTGISVFSKARQLNRRLLGCPN